ISKSMTNTFLKCQCSADWQSAVSPIGNRQSLNGAERAASPRYSRLPVGATPCCSIIMRLAVSIALFLFTAVLPTPTLAASRLAASDPTEQTDADWVDGRWQQTEVGPFLSAAIETPRKKTCK